MTAAAAKGRFDRWKLPLQMAVSFGLLAFLLHKANVAAMIESARHVHAGWVGAALCLFVALQTCSSFKWWLILRYGGHRVPYTACLKLYFVGMFFNLLMPTGVGGDTVRAALVRQWVPLRNAIASVFLERFTGFAAMVAIGIVGMSGTHLSDTASTETIGVFGALILLCFLLFLVRCPAALRPKLPACLAKPRKFWYEKISSPMRSHFGRPHQFIVVMLLSLGFQSTIVGIHAMLVQSTSAHAPLLVICMVYPLATIVGMTPVTLNGLGFREGAYVVLFGRAGMSSADALTVAILWAFILWAAALPGAVLWWTRNRSTTAVPAGLQTDDSLGQEQVIEK